MLSTTLVRASRSTVGIPPPCAATCRPAPAIEPSANTPPATAPSFRNSRRSMVTSPRANDSIGAMPPQALKIDHARYVLTLDPQRRIIQDGAILIENGRLARVGKAAELASARADRVIDGRQMVVTPGFVNG